MYCIGNTLYLNFSGGLGISTHRPADKSTGDHSVPIHLAELRRGGAEDHWFHPRPCRRTLRSTSHWLLSKTALFQGSVHAEDTVLCRYGGDKSFFPGTENAHHQELPRSFGAIRKERQHPEHIAEIGISQLQVQQRITLFLIIVEGWYVLRRNDQTDSD